MSSLELGLRDSLDNPDPIDIDRWRHPLERWPKGCSWKSCWNSHFQKASHAMISIFNFNQFCSDGISHFPTVSDRDGVIFSSMHYDDLPTVIRSELLSYRSVYGRWCEGWIISCISHSALVRRSDKNRRSSPKSSSNGKGGHCATP